MTERDFREQTVANLAALTEAVGTLKESVAELADSIHEGDIKGYACRKEVDAAITEVRTDLERQVASVRVRIAYAGGALGSVGVAAGILLALLGK